LQVEPRRARAGHDDAVACGLFRRGGASQRREAGAGHADGARIEFNQRVAGRDDDVAVERQQASREVVKQREG
jgi:hypothetical protein